MNSDKVAAIWCRVSTHDQRELSLDSQEVAVRKVLEAEGYKVLPQHILKVDWTSLDLMGCPEFQQLRRWIADGTAQAVEVLDENGHGSHVASTAAGKLASSDLGMLAEGVSRAPIYSVKALGRGVGTGFTSEVVNAMALALERGAQVVNMSLGSKECQGGCETCPECRAVKRLTERGVLVAMAAGNSGPEPNTIGCPGCAEEAITVAAVDRDGRVAGFSSRGGGRFPDKPDVAAPGVNIYSGTARGSLVDAGDLDAGFGYAAISGTSMATPHVAGLLALLKHRNPAMTERDFKAVMRSRGGPFNNATGWGVSRWSWFS